MMSSEGHADWAEIYLDAALSGGRCQDETSLIIQSGSRHALVLSLCLLVIRVSPSPFISQL